MAHNGWVVQIEWTDTCGMSFCKWIGNAAYFETDDRRLAHKWHYKRDAKLCADRLNTHYADEASRKVAEVVRAMTY